LCGSDLHSFEGRRPVPVPTVLGHEIVGEIIERGTFAPERDLAGHELRIGDRVTWAIVAACGTCLFCRRGLPQKCERGLKYGHEPIRPGDAARGGLAEHCLLAPNTAIVRLADELPLTVACPASCATATIAAAMEAAGDVRDRIVCVSGAGMLGLTAVAMAKTSGAAAVVCIDPQLARRERALAFGATRIAAPEELGSTAPDEHEADVFDVVVELSGQPAAFRTIWPLVRTGGNIVLVGSVFPAEEVSLSLEQIVRRHLTICGIHNYAPRHLLRAVEFLTAQHRAYPFGELVGKWYPLTAIQEAFAGGGMGQFVRVGVDPRLG
jgi:alcohol dehydrogenase